MPLQKWSEAFAQFRNMFTVFYAEGVVQKESKKYRKGERSNNNNNVLSTAAASEETVGTGSPRLNPQEDLLNPYGKKKKSMSLFYYTLDYPELALTVPRFAISKQSCTFINTVNTARDHSDLLMELHVLFREGYANTGVSDWKSWQIFRALAINDLYFEENTRKYTGELVNDQMHGYGVY